MKTFLFAVATLAILFAGGVRAQVPRTISYQGMIVNGVNPENGSDSITMSLYDTVQGGTSLYRETQDVTIVNGIFNMLIGSKTPIPASLKFDHPYYLGVSFNDGTELSPRSQLTTVPYAISSDSSGVSLKSWTASVAYNLAPGGSAGEVLTSQGNNNPPSWESIQSTTDTSQVTISSNCGCQLMFVLIQNGSNNVYVAVDPKSIVYVIENDPQTSTIHLTNGDTFSIAMGINALTPKSMPPGGK